MNTESLDLSLFILLGGPPRLKNSRELHQISESAHRLRGTGILGWRGSRGDRARAGWGQGVCEVRFPCTRCPLVRGRATPRLQQHGESMLVSHARAAQGHWSPPKVRSLLPSPHLGETPGTLAQHTINYEQLLLLLRCHALP